MGILSLKTLFHENSGALKYGKQSCWSPTEMRIVCFKFFMLVILAGKMCLLEFCAERLCVYFNYMNSIF